MTALATLDSLREMPVDQLEAELARLDEIARLGKALLTVRRRSEQREREYQTFVAGDEARLALHEPEAGGAS